LENAFANKTPIEEIARSIGQKSPNNRIPKKVETLVSLFIGEENLLNFKA